MYSIVVAAVLSTSAPAPGFNGFFSNAFSMRGCNGCQGSCTGCQGCSGCQGCNGGCNGCSGCCGGYGFLGFRDFWHNVFSRNCNGCCGGGCNGGCSGYSNCCGGMGGCSGCCGGGMPMYSNSCYGGSSYSFGMPIDSYPMMGEMAAPMTMAPQMMNPNEMMATAPAQMPQGPAPQAYQSSTPPNQATVIVTLPADARLYVDGQVMTLTGPVRQFRSGDLAPGAKYAYTVRMEVERNGRTLDETKTIELQPGKTSNVHFAEPGTPGAPARITAKMPEGATLFVENQAWPVGQKTIMTPALTNGQTYTYTLRLERNNNGRKETQTKDVTIRCGDELTVEFDAETYMVNR